MKIVTVKSNKVRYSIGILVALLLAVYLTGVFAQLLQIGITWLQYGSSTGLMNFLIPFDMVTESEGAAEYIAEPITQYYRNRPLYHPLPAIQALFIRPYSFYGGIVTLALCGLVAMFFLKNSEVRGTLDKERNLIYSDKGTHGTAGWMSKHDMYEMFDIVSLTNKVHGKIVGKVLEMFGKKAAGAPRVQGDILGMYGKKVICAPVDDPKRWKYNKHAAVYGASGAGKTQSYVLNKIFQCVRRGESLILTDPKGELYGIASEFLRDSGYTVKVFNLVTPKNSDSWNCLREIECDEPELMAQMFANVIIRNTTLGGRPDPFWDNGSESLLKAICLYVVIGDTYAPEDKTIGEVYNLIANASGDQLKAAFGALPPSHPAKTPFSIFCQTNDQVQSGLIMGLAIRIQVFQIEAIRNITSYGIDQGGIDLTLPGKEKCAYFLIISDQNSTFHFLSSLFLSFMFIKLIGFADSQKSRRFPVTVHLLGDEIANVGTIPDFKEKMSTIRSRGMSVSLIIQSIAQLENRYPEKAWSEIISACDVQLFLGCNEPETATFISDRTGEVTVGVEGQMKSLSTLRMTNYTEEYRMSESVGKRKLLTPDEVMRLSRDKTLVFLSGMSVIKVDKFWAWHHPDYQYIRESNATEYIPEWRIRVIDGRQVDVLTGEVLFYSVDIPPSQPPTPPTGKTVVTAYKKKPPPSPVPIEKPVKASVEKMESFMEIEPLYEIPEINYQKADEDIPPQNNKKEAKRVGAEQAPEVLEEKGGGAEVEISTFGSDFESLSDLLDSL